MMSDRLCGLSGPPVLLIESLSVRFPLVTTRCDFKVHDSALGCLVALSHAAPEYRVSFAGFLSDYCRVTGQGEPLGGEEVDFAGPTWA